MRNNLPEALHILRRRGLVVVPTETFYGIACDARNPEAVRRLLLLKGREEGKPVPLIAGGMKIVRSLTSIAFLERYRKSGLDLEALAERFWPGPLTLVLPAISDLPSEITAGTGTIGIRVPGPSVALDLARQFGGALTATSANLSGKAPPRSAADVDPKILEGMDMVVDGDDTPGGQPSTVLDLTADPPRIIRPGVLYEEVREFLKQSRVQSPEIEIQSRVQSPESREKDQTW